MAKIQVARGSDGVAKAGGARGPDAVEHVGSEGDGNEEVFWVTYPHYVAGFLDWEEGCTC